MIGASAAPHCKRADGNLNANVFTWYVILHTHIYKVRRTKYNVQDQYTILWMGRNFPAEFLDNVMVTAQTPGDVSMGVKYHNETLLK